MLLGIPFLVVIQLFNYSVVFLIVIDSFAFVI